MTNTMSIEGRTAVISFDPELGQFRGEFFGLNGGADFYASSVEELRREGARSLRTFMEVCAEHGIEPLKRFSGKFVVRVPAELHERVTEAATAEGVSLNQWVKQALEREVHTWPMNAQHSLHTDEATVATAFDVDLGDRG